MYHPSSLCTRVFSVPGLLIIDQWQFFGADDYTADLVQIALIAHIALKFASACTLFESVTYWSGQIPFYTRMYHLSSLCTRVFSVPGLLIIDQWQFFAADDYTARFGANRAYSA